MRQESILRVSSKEKSTSTEYFAVADPRRPSPIFRPNVARMINLENARKGTGVTINNKPSYLQPLPRLPALGPWLADRDVGSMLKAEISDEDGFDHVADTLRAHPFTMPILCDFNPDRVPVDVRSRPRGRRRVPCTINRSSGTQIAAEFSP